MRQQSTNLSGEMSRGEVISIYVLAGLYWLASTFFAGMVIYVLREAVMSLTVLLSLPPEKPSASELFYLNLQMHALDSSLFILYGAAMILATVIFESIFSHWAFRADVKQAFLKIIVLESALIALLALLALLFGGILNGFNWQGLGDPILALLWLGFITWQWRAFHNQPRDSLNSI